MSRTRYRSLPAHLLLLAGCALAAAGCTRTDDGTVVVARELDVGRYWRRPPSPPQTPPVQSGSQVFPVRPMAGARPAATRQKPVRATRRAPGRDAPAHTLACRDDVRPDGRARVVCE